jgi:hypothetical protein
MTLSTDLACNYDVPQQDEKRERLHFRAQRMPACEAIQQQ